ncbi:histidinol-phosphatase HisJ [Ligilactobacillus sp. WILCCON 0076]|uniref:Histidinol-phosphatase n=1 Tax=Ligilactobacillus ubinensis TaxID=2876789 RepID=A0A9X2FRE7_9LACO|nr:histidinol-phosphatase HisJ [Ligilactobacillus ubinensis]MCP0887688.1 histidinol-phosphatase HisJ [Ligilactobacillus ubinensis]
MKIEGHSHTELCPHGSGDSVEKMIMKAIKLGFTDYCITEHAPLPQEFNKCFAGNLIGLKTASLRSDQVDEYLKLGQDMQEKFANQINISVGFEVDYLQGFETEIKQFLDEVGPYTDQNILSLHYMPGIEQKFYGIDYDTLEFATGFGPWLDEPDILYGKYFAQIKRLVDADLGEYTPKRIGHMSLIKKYQDYFNFPSKWDSENIKQIKEILDELKEQGRELDFNTAGLRKPYCNDFYPGKRIVELAQERDIPLVFGSDAHSLEEVGAAWHLYEDYEN